jgi:hypothetical protein
MTQNDQGRCQEWEKEYQKFIKGGDPHKSYMEHLDHCLFCGAAAEKVFNESCKAFEEFARLLRKQIKDST